uniref:protein FAM246B-like n=1 Tax=Jaculus jaculus TaxID=51337 RepID=UPI001E1B245C|nr:protein FAM246B-like [Jaculus jaculus]
MNSSWGQPSPTPQWLPINTPLKLLARRESGGDVSRSSSGLPRGIRPPRGGHGAPSAGVSRTTWVAAQRSGAAPAPQSRGRPGRGCKTSSTSEPTRQPHLSFLTRRRLASGLGSFHSQTGKPAPRWGVAGARARVHAAARVLGAPQPPPPTPPAPSPPRKERAASERASARRCGTTCARRPAARAQSASAGSRRPGFAHGAHARRPHPGLRDLARARAH